MRKIKTDSGNMWEEIKPVEEVVKEPETNTNDIEEQIRKEIEKEIEQE